MKAQVKVGSNRKGYRRNRSAHRGPTAAVGALGSPSVTGFMNQVFAYLRNVIAVILIFVVC